MEIHFVHASSCDFATASTSHAEDMHLEIITCYDIVFGLFINETLE